MARNAAAGDASRAGAPSDPVALIAGMLEILGTDPLWAGEYQDFVDAVSFASPAERISFDQALAAVRELARTLGGADG